MSTPTRPATGNDRLTTDQAAERLGVKVETLYAYVSRGLIQRERGPDGSTFARRDVDRLARSSRRAKRLPALVFPSSLTQIDDHHVRYRGLDAVELSSQWSYEQVAEWLWSASTDVERWTDPPWASGVAHELPDLPESALPLDHIRLAVALGAALDDHRHATDHAAVARTGRALVRTMVAAVPLARGARRTALGPDQPIAEALWRRLSPLPATDARVAVLDAALVLLADHELATSTLAVRAAAMVRADTYEVVGTGLNVIGGARHGGVSLGLESLLRDAEVVGAARAVDGRLAAGHEIGGFGHPLYDRGDPRAAPLLDRLDELDGSADRRTTAAAFLQGAADRGLPTPNIDAALAAVGWCARMRPGAGETIFAIARTAGWIAHALEQYDQPTLMRARVDYVGEPPRAVPNIEST